MDEGSSHVLQVLFCAMIFCACATNSQRYTGVLCRPFQIFRVQLSGGAFELQGKYPAVEQSAYPFSIGAIERDKPDPTPVPRRQVVGAQLRDSSSRPLRSAVDQ